MDRRPGSTANPRNSFLRASRTDLGGPQEKKVEKSRETEKKGQRAKRTQRLRRRADLLLEKIKRPDLLQEDLEEVGSTVYYWSPKEEGRGVRLPDERGMGHTTNVHESTPSR